MTVACVAVTSAGRQLAADLAAHLDGHVFDRVEDAWSDADQLVLVMATGIAARLIAPHLGDKRDDPGVVVVDEAARFAVALTGGHEGGANRLAERVAAFLGAIPVVTTASDAAGQTALSELGAGFGLRVEPASDTAAVGAALLSGGPVHLLRERPWPLGPLPNVTEVDQPRAPLLWVTDRLVDPPRPCVLYRPPSLVVGMGASRGVAVDEVGELADTALADAGLSATAVACLATADVKADEPGLVAAAAERQWDLVTIPAARLAATEVPNPSRVVADAVGTPSVAEAAALHLGGELVVEKRRSARATVAVARRPVIGHLALVSLGPGDPDLVPPLARRALTRAEVVVGYARYVDLARPLLRRGTTVEPSPLGDEITRAERCLELARQGRSVALVSSGDIGVYAMASPTLELAGGDVTVEIVPGITAAPASAALLGAPLGHDHCTLSLSDLLTPWKVIRRRIRAAAEADLVLALYNPRSRNRDWQLEEARALLLEHRPADTPVGLVRNAYRTGQQVRLTTLADLDVDTVDMLTVVIVGSSRTRVVAGRMVTPRGYQP